LIFNLDVYIVRLDANCNCKAWHPPMLFFQSGKLFLIGLNFVLCWKNWLWKFAEMSRGERFSSKQVKSKNCNWGLEFDNIFFGRIMSQQQPARKLLTFILWKNSATMTKTLPWFQIRNCCCLNMRGWQDTCTTTLQTMLLSWIYSSRSHFTQGNYFSWPLVYPTA